MAERVKRSTTMLKWQNREIALGNRMKSVGEPVSALVGHLAKQDVPSITAIFIIIQAYDLNLGDAREAYELHPLVQHRWAVRQCERLIAEGVDRPEICHTLRLGGYTEEQIEKVLQDCTGDTEERQ